MTSNRTCGGGSVRETDSLIPLEIRARLHPDASRDTVSEWGARIAETKPRTPQMHLFQEPQSGGYALYIPNGSRVYRLPEKEASRLAAASRQGEAATRRALTEIGLEAPPFIHDAPPEKPPVRALSLAVAQKCNLGCTYCYAQEGNFGSPERDMPLETALAAVELLFSEAEPGERVNLSFLGGEPLTNRTVLRTVTEHAARLAAARKGQISFSITTNGTLLTEEDGAFFEQYGFAVTISLDGVGEIHDRQRPYKNGKGSYAHILRKVAPLLAQQEQMQVSARVTVTAQNMCLRETLDAFIQMGFHSVGFSPVLRSPNGRDEMQGAEFAALLEQMVACGEEFERQMMAGKRYPFLNMVNALREIHRGTHRPYPCGAGAGYLGVAADGRLSACHRFVGDEDGAMGNLTDGVDRYRQETWLAQRHVHQQEPCRGCWARYMCGGGCHHEVIRRGRPACDYIRGWLHYSLQAYLRLLQAQPDYFGASDIRTDGK